MNKPSTQRIVIGSAIAISVFAAIVVYQWDATRRGAELEMTIAKMPLGILASEAFATIGETPDTTSQQAGVLVTPATMLTDSNSKAVEYGPPQDYTLHTWQQGDVGATVAIDANGKVAGRWALR